MPAYAYVVILAGTVLWFSPFVARFNFKAPQTIDRRARWGMLLELVAYSLLWQGSFWTRLPETWQMAISVIFLALANLLSWSGTRALGRQLRLDAAVGSEHELIRSGPYRLVRHPIYTSMLCVILGNRHDHRIAPDAPGLDSPVRHWYRDSRPRGRRASGFAIRRRLQRLSTLDLALYSTSLVS